LSHTNKKVTVAILQKNCQVNKALGENERSHGSQEEERIRLPKIFYLARFAPEESALLFLAFSLIPGPDRELERAL
jgi:hypothetical protein